MRVKVGDQWFEATETTPIMVELTDKDRENITNMLPDKHYYATFTASPRSSKERDDMLSWMAEGARLL